MAAAKYYSIYEDLKDKIEKLEYNYGSMLPSEHSLIEVYDCSRNTIRRAISLLAAEGYIQSIHGKGVQIIYQPENQPEVILGGLESLKEAAVRIKKEYYTKVIGFEERIVDLELHRKCSFPVGAHIYYIQRVRYMDGKARIIDHNYFLKEIARELTVEIAEHSIYEYMEQQLGEAIVTTKRKLTVELASELDETYMELRGYNCVALVTSNTYNADGVMFEYTESRHRPDYFAFYDQAQRIKT